MFFSVARNSECRDLQHSLLLWDTVSLLQKVPNLKRLSLGVSRQDYTFDSTASSFAVVVQHQSLRYAQAYLLQPGSNNLGIP